MKKIRGLLLLIGFAFTQISFGQNTPSQQEEKRIAQKLEDLEKVRAGLLAEQETVKLARIREILQITDVPAALPGNPTIWHSAMALEYSESHEQARWVAHVILPEIKNGVVSRTNDFRPDSLVLTGSAVEADYFLKYLQPDSSYRYDGFGYDRGHLAPSADFRWSYKALSESYLYSNMSPQLDSFNRGIWGDLEDKLREYVLLNPGTALQVLTGPVLSEDLPRIERGIHKVTIPKYYWKVALDLERNRAIGFVLPNKAGYQPLESYAVTIDSVERLTKIRFWPKMEEAKKAGLAKQRNLAEWFAEVATGDVEPVPISDLKRGQINTVMARQNIGSRFESEVVGKVVSARTSRAGNVLLNLDKQYPKEVFTLFIKKEDLANFGYDPIETLKGMTIAVKGKIGDLGGKATMYVSRAKAISIIEEVE